MANAEYHPWSGGIDFCETINQQNQDDNPLAIASGTYFQLIGNTLYLYVNGNLMQTWTAASNLTGQSIGLLLALTYP